MLKGYKYRIYPSNSQKQLLQQAFGNARFVFNNSLAHKKNLYEKEQKSLSKFDLINRLPNLKKDFDFLKLSPSQSLQMSIGHLDSAYKNFFRRVKQGQNPGFPKFKSKFAKQTLSFPQGVNVHSKESKIQIPKIGKVLGILHRRFPEDAKIKTCTLSKSLTNKYFISILVDDGQKLPIKTFGKTIGIDLGIKDFVTFSDGTKIQSEKFLSKYLKKLKIAQKRLSLKKKGSNNRQKTKFKLAKIYEKITNCRQDNLHKISKRIIDENQLIIIEDLNVKSMMKNTFRSLASENGNPKFELKAGIPVHSEKAQQ